jgi:hypothetical protein
MRNQNTYVANFVLITVFSIIFLGLMTWGNYQYASQNPGGNDFLVHWVGTRALVFESLNPYSDEVALRIQTIAYGRPAQPGEHELRVAYPLYSVIVFLPFSLINDFTWARAAWMTALEASLLLLTALSGRLARWKIGPAMLALLLLFGLFWYHGLRPLINGNAVVLVTLGLVGGFLALRNGADELAGVLFAFTTIKPQVVVLVLAFIVFWGLSTGRWRLIGWLFGTVVLLAASASLLIPAWPLDNLREVMLYPSYNPPGTPRAAFVEWWPAWGDRLGWVLTLVLAVILLFEWGLNRKAEFRGFLWMAYMTLVISQWIGIQTDPGNFIVLFPVLILVLALLDQRWKGGGRLFVVLSLIGLFVGIWAVFLNTVEYGDQPVQSAVMFFPLPAFLFLTLYWVRWWAVQPRGLWYETLEL